jgi:hypothetical protein
MRTPRPDPSVYWAKIGTGPWTCHECNEPVTTIGQARMDGNVHHLDEDPWNNDPANLVVMHVLCHRREHGTPMTAREKISEKLKGRVSPTKGMTFSAEVNAKKGRSGEANAMHGKRHSEETLERMRKPRTRITCEHCGVDYASSWIERHRQDGQCRPRRVIVISGTPRIRGVEAKPLCADCGKPYAARWFERHKREGRCITP